MSIKTQSEVLFERYLVENGLSFEHEKPYQGKSKLVDYTVPIHGQDWLFEVKQLESNKSFAPSGPAVFDPYPPIYAKIKEGQKKFKEYDGMRCCLVLYNNGRDLAMISDPNIMCGAMYGRTGWTMNFDPELGCAVGDPEPAFLSGGKMIGFNTRISAVIALREYNLGTAKYTSWVKRQWQSAGNLPEPDFDVEEKKLCVIVFENAYADIPFPNDIFNGEFDARYGQVGQNIERKHWGSGLIGDHS